MRNTWVWLSPAIVVSWALILIALERRFAYDPRQRLFREGLWVDFLGYTLAQSYALGLAITWIITSMDAYTGWSKRGLISGWPVWLQFTFFLVTHDLYIYLFHRLQHHNRWLWRIHEAHHSTKDVDWLSGSRSHSLEILINQTIEFAPIALLGAAPEVAALKVTVDAIWGMYIHSNVNVRPGWWSYVFVGPELHRWHHAIEITQGGLNFGTKLAIWDTLFKTRRVPPVKPRGYGLSDVDFPNGYLSQHLFAFRRFAHPNATANTPAEVALPRAST